MIRTILLSAALMIITPIVQCSEELNKQVEHVRPYSRYFFKKDKAETLKEIPDRKGNTALHILILKDELPFLPFYCPLRALSAPRQMEVLLALGLSPYTKNNRGKTPLDLATARNQDDGVITKIHVEEMATLLANAMTKETKTLSIPYRLQSPLVAR